jgi:hypothetical protein
MYVFALMALVGCDAFNKAKNTIDGLLDPVVVEGIVLAIEPPENAELSELLGNSDYQAGTTVTVFMADAREVDEIENAPISGAAVTVSGPGVDASVAEIEAGVYLLTPVDDDVPYTSGDTWELHVVRTSGDQTATSTARLALPVDADFTSSIPQQHQPDTAIELDFTGLGFDAALVVVFDQEGEVTYSNEPNDVREVYEFTHGGQELGVITLPATAFPGEGVFAVGVAGMVNTDAADLTEMNTALSTVMMGKMRLYGVSTVALPLP